MRVAHKILSLMVTNPGSTSSTSDRLYCAFAHANRIQREMSMLFCDLDWFEQVNHAVGDQMLPEICRRLRGCCAMATPVARIGGDGFVIVVEPACRKGGVEILPHRAQEGPQERVAP